jgi:hypothetical protein
MEVISSEKSRKNASMPFLENEASRAWAVQSFGSETTIPIFMDKSFGEADI